jgi:RNA polymerase sigma-70 factor (sigma-E family)
VHEPAGFAEFVRERSRPLLRAGWLLTGDWASAEDLVQTALARTWPKWDGIAVAAREAYVRRVMVRTLLAWRRRRWSAEVASDEVGDDTSLSDPYDAADTRRALIAALRRLPVRQRAVIVLRYFDDLTEIQTAHALGCTVGTVKVHHARAVRALRASGALAGMDEEEFRE